MRIAILGQFSFPGRIKDYFCPDDQIYRMSPHPHPWIWILAEALARIAANEVYVLTMMGNIKEDRTFRVNGATYMFLRSTSIVCKALTAFKSNTWKIRKMLARIGPDVVHVQGRAYRESYAGLTSGFPCVLTNHGQISEYYRAYGTRGRCIEYFVNLWKEARSDRLTEWCIGVSPNCTAPFEDFVQDDRVFLIDNPIDRLFFSGRSETYGNALLYVGSITPLKRVLELVRAVHKVREAELDIVSFTQEGDYYDTVRRYIVSNGLEGRMRLLGPKSPGEIIETAKDCLALCLPSAYESFGMVLAEAMAMGKPVIASRAGGIPYLVADGHDGFLVDPGNVEQIAEKIALLIRNRSIAATMGQEAKRKALERWHPDIIAEKTLRVYERMLAQGRPGRGGM